MKRGVLVVLDDPSRCEPLRAAIEERGLGVAHSDPVRALEGCATSSPAAAVLDLNAVGATELFARLRERHPELPVVVLARRGDVDEVVSCLRSGAADYVPGPFDPVRIRSSVERVVRDAGHVRLGGWPAAGEVPVSRASVTNGANGTNGLNGHGSASSTEDVAFHAHEPTSVEDIRPLAEHERRLILQALELTDWNAQEAAARLGIGRATIYRKIDRFKLRGERGRTTVGRQ